MSRTSSPLRYPGGKHVLAGLLHRLIDLNGASGGTYAEAYAGGAGAALSLLFSEHVDHIVINDADRRVYAFWRAALDHPREFVDLINRTPLTIAEWREQRRVYQSPRQSFLRLGFATFYLNRCNRSGIIGSGGPIGGLHQTGEWKLDARFNRVELAARIQRLADYRERISVFNMDALAFLGKLKDLASSKTRLFCYLDPPYYRNGPELYMNHYARQDHAVLASRLLEGTAFPWVLTYDNAAPIRSLYRRLRQSRFSLRYTANDRRKASELLILQPGLCFPGEWRHRVPASVLYPSTVTASKARR